MLKDKKIIIHKTDGKTFIPITGRSYRTNSSYGFCLSFQFLTLYAIVAAIFVCKTRKTNLFLQRTLWFNIFHFTPPTSTGPSGGGRQEAAGRICSLLPETSCVCVWSTSTVPNTELSNKLKRGLFSFTPFAPWDEYSRTTHILVAKTRPI